VQKLDLVAPPVNKYENIAIAGITLQVVLYQS
jgi:hypothetical protein